MRARAALGSSVLVGYDGRAGAAEIATLAVNLLTDRGLACHLAADPSPTPALGRLVDQRPDLTAAVIVTASHNPPGFIGVKLRDAHAHGILWPQPAEGATIEPPTAPSRNQPHRIDVLASYVNSVGHTLLEAVARFDGHLIIDAAHGAVGALAAYLPTLAWHRARPLPFFAGHTPDPAFAPKQTTSARRCCTTSPPPSRL